MDIMRVCQAFLLFVPSTLRCSHRRICKGRSVSAKAGAYLPKPHFVLLWHCYLVLTKEEYPLLRTLSVRRGIPVSTVFDFCRKQRLLLA